MASDAEILSLARQVARHELHPDVGTWYLALTEDEQRRVLAYAVYEISFQRRIGPRQRRAQRLLRQWLPLPQRVELKYTREFRVTGSAGGRYKFRPSCGYTYRLERHGQYEYCVSRFCFHDEAEELPNADLTLAHYLLIVTDEPAFLAAANEHPMKSSQWDGAWRRRLNQARRDRAAGLIPPIAVCPQLDVLPEPYGPGSLAVRVA